MTKERAQQVGTAGLIGAVAGAALTAHRGRAAAAAGARWRGLDRSRHELAQPGPDVLADHPAGTVPAGTFMVPTGSHG